MIVRCVCSNGTKEGNNLHTKFENDKSMSRIMNGPRGGGQTMLSYLALNSTHPLNPLTLNGPMPES